MKEIGGYFELETFNNNEYYKDMISLNSGGNALLYIMQAKKIKKILIPNYLCDSISNLLEKNCYDYELYSIDSKFIPKLEKINTDSYLLLVNYYGQLNKKVIIDLKKKYKNIILDNSQAFFCDPIKGIDTFYSCRKYFGVPDGAYLFTDIKIKKRFPTDISKDRMKHILGRYECNASDYYKDFLINEVKIGEQSLKIMSQLTKNLLSAIDYRKVIIKRNENYQYLSDHLSKYNKLIINRNKGPFSYPFYMENGFKARNILSKKKIYIPILWPNVIKNTSNKNDISYIYSKNILPLPCDQRYNLEDMNYIIDETIKIL